MIVLDRVGFRLFGVVVVVGRRRRFGFLSQFCNIDFFYVRGGGTKKVKGGYIHR
jgi:hypothetical protein